MNFKYLLCSCVVVLVFFTLSFVGSGCAQIGTPTGGPRDSIAPVLVSANPGLKTVNFKGDRIVLTFDEYVDVQDVQNNVLVSPFPKINPQITFKLKQVSIKLRDTLKENTTYAINFGNAIRDNNEGNPYKNFTYVFSTGNTIDSLQVSGNVIMAESGKTDSTLAVLLYRDAVDSMVETRKPDYLTKLTSDGKFVFTNLAAGTYKIYALKDGDGRKTYDSKTEAFAFYDNDLNVADTSTKVTLYAYVEEKEKPRPVAAPTTAAAKAADKKLKYTSPVPAQQQELLTNLDLTFNHPLKTLDSTKILLTDTLGNKISGSRLKLDTTGKILSVINSWQEETRYNLLVSKDAVTDTSGGTLSRSDTLKFMSKKNRDYGSLTLRFTNYKSGDHIVIQFVINDEVVKSAPLASGIWSEALIKPGDYELRILYDANNNGKWDPGNYHKKLQPERAITLDKKLTIKANFDNEREIKL